MKADWPDTPFLLRDLAEAIPPPARPFTWIPTPPPLRLLIFRFSVGPPSFY